MVRSVEYCDASVVHLCLQEGVTAILIAAFYCHLTVLRTLVEQYGGNVLNRYKVIKVLYDERYGILFVCGEISHYTFY